VHVPSRTDPSVAPEGKDALFILVPVAPGLQDDNQIRNEFSDRVIKKLEDIVGEEIKNHIEVQKIFSHRNFQNSYNAYEGAAFGLAHTLFQTAMFRPRNYSKKVQNLYHAGQYTNPGVGMPIALISAEIVRKMIAKNS
jgi:phytoene desaturase